MGMAYGHPRFDTMTKVFFHPRMKNGETMVGEKGGIAVMGKNFATLALESREDGTFLVQTDCIGADKGNDEMENSVVRLNTNGPVWLQAVVRMTGKKNPKAKSDYKCAVTFRYSFDGKKFTDIGSPMDVREGQWIGAKIGVFCTRPWKSNDSGWLDVDSFIIDK